MMKSIYKRCDKLLISSRGFENSIRQIGGYEGQYVYFPNWIEQTGTADSMPSDLPDLPDGFKIVFTGNIGVAQDFGTVLDAAEKLKTRSDLHWIIVGDGREANWVREEVARRGLEHCFHLPGHYPLSAMPYFQANADAFLLTLRDVPVFALTVPRKLQAYFAAGKPVLASIAGEGAELVNSARAGLTCNPQSPDELAQAVNRLLAMNEQQRSELGENGKLYCRQHFEPATVFSRLDDVLDEVTGRKNRRMPQPVFVPETQCDEQTLAKAS